MKRKRKAFVKVLEKVKLVLVNIRFRLDIGMPVMVINLGIGFRAWQTQWESFEKQTHIAMEVGGSSKKKIAMQTLSSKNIPNPFSFLNPTIEWFTNQSPSYGVELKTHIETTDQRHRRSRGRSVLNLGLEKLSLVDLYFDFCMNMGFGFFSHESERTKD